MARDDSEYCLHGEPKYGCEKCKKEVTMNSKERQRRSFAYGNTHMSNPNITRETIDRAAERLAVMSDKDRLPSIELTHEQLLARLEAAEAKIATYENMNPIEMNSLYLAVEATGADRLAVEEIKRLTGESDVVAAVRSLLASETENVRLLALVQAHHDVGSIHKVCGRNAIAHHWGKPCTVCVVSSPAEPSLLDKILGPLKNTPEYRAELAEIRFEEARIVYEEALNALTTKPGVKIVVAPPDEADLAGDGS